MNKLDSKLGSSKTYSEYIARFAKSISVKNIYFFENPYNRHESYNQNEYKIVKIGKAVKIINDMVNNVYKK